jgi:hypothetical protein
MRKFEAVFSNARVSLSALLVVLVVFFACAASPSVPASSEGQQNSSSSAENGLKQENLSYTDRLAWRSHLHWPQDCESSFDYPDKTLAGLAFYQLSDKHSLVQVTCTLGAYQGTYVFLLLDESASPARSNLLHFMTYEDSGETGPGRLQKTQATELTGTPEFDRSSKQLRIINKFRGLGDCGFLTSYSFSKGEPELTGLQGKLDCCGKTTNPRDWGKIPPR